MGTACSYRRLTPRIYRTRSTGSTDTKTDAGCDKRKITNEPITKSNTNMETADQIEPTPGVASERGLNTRTADVLLSPQREQATDKNAIHPFHVNVPEAELTELRTRINATKWPERETVADATQGVQLCDDPGARSLLGDRV
jgi:hypothetical protein